MPYGFSCRIVAERADYTREQDEEQTRRWGETGYATPGRRAEVGVVGDTPNGGLHEPPAPSIYVPYTLMLSDSLNVVRALFSVVNSTVCSTVATARDAFTRADSNPAAGILADHAGFADVVPSGRGDYAQNTPDFLSNSARAPLD